ncbi:MAG: hypothetical protein KDK40_02990 [Chlamydiia bacterium]|nr:hypothetical protein [Chlamydiia bacterium]
MNKQNLIKKLKRLEKKHVELYAELDSLDELMRAIGFTHGLQTVKQTAVELGETKKHEGEASGF